MSERPPVIDRLLARVELDANDCWIFTGARRNGYGVVGLGGRAAGIGYAHRLTYTYFIADIPDGLHIDHLCRVRECCNPWHLEPVSQAENNRRARESTGPATHCRRGHEFTPDNTINWRTQRLCRTCHEIRRFKNRTAA